MIKAIYNRDIAGNNIFIQYPERDDSRPEPPEGLQANAFPEVVLGDFGQGAIQGDIPEAIREGRWGEPEVIESWHDTYAIFSVVHELCTQHIPHSVYLDLRSNIPC